MIKSLRDLFPSPPPEYSIVSTHPELAKEWNFQKNNPLKPEYFTFGSGKKVWWKCAKGDDHEWMSTISNRSIGNGCPFCSGKKPSNAYNLSITHSELCKEWNYVKNRPLRPEDFTRGSDKEVWWLCSKGHSYKVPISRRTLQNSGCSYCSGRRSLTKDLFE